MRIRTSRGLLAFALAALAGAACSSGAPTPSSSPAPLVRVVVTPQLADAIKAAGTVYSRTSGPVRFSYSVVPNDGLGRVTRATPPPDLVAGFTPQEAGALDGGPFGTPSKVASDEVVLALPATNPGLVGSVKDLARASVSVGLAASETADGAAARTVLERLDHRYGGAFASGIEQKAKVRSVAALVAALQHREVDAALLSRSAVSGISGVQLIDLPAGAGADVVYEAALRSNGPAAADSFLTFLSSPAAVEPIRKAGLEPAGSAS